jgi:hypothetical protein
MHDILIRSKLTVCPTHAKKGPLAANFKFLTSYRARWKQQRDEKYRTYFSVDGGESLAQRNPIQ